MSPTDFLIVVGGVLAAGSAIYTFGRGAWRWLRRLSHFIDDVTGEEPRNGQPRRPGLVEQVDLVRQRQEEIAADASRAATDAAQAAADVAIIKHELTTNGGTSVKDVVNSTSRKLSEHLGNPNAHDNPKSQ